MNCHNLPIDIQKKIKEFLDKNAIFVLTMFRLIISGIKMIHLSFVVTIVLIGFSYILSREKTCCWIIFHYKNWHPRSFVPHH